MAKPTITVDVKNLEVFKSLAECTTVFLSDERIDKSIRQEHYDRIAQFLPVEGGVQ